MLLALSAALWMACDPLGPVPPAPPAAPTSVTTSVIDTSRIDVTWAHPGAGITEFRVERRTGTSPFGHVGTVPPSGRLFEDEELSTGTPYEYRLRACAAANLCSWFTPTVYATTHDAGDRFADDAPDDSTGPQIHVMYVLPRDAIDRRLDLNGRLATSVASFHNWFMLKSGLRIRLDTRDGELDVTGFRLARRDEEIKAFGSGVLFQIFDELSAAGKLASGKTYLVYYDGGSTYSCGGAMWPGPMTAMYLKGTPPGASCGGQHFVSSPTDFPRYWEFAALHDLLHTFGIVSPAAPNHQNQYPAHVPEQHDLMYTGPGSWTLNQTTTIDVGGNDYFGANVPDGIANLANTPFVTPIPAAAVGTLAEPDHSVMERLQRLIHALPPHEPLAPRAIQLAPRDR